MADVELKWHGNRVKALIKAGTAAGLAEAAEHLLGEAIELVPIEAGTLQDSGVATVDAAKGKAAVAFDTEYAVDQHENPDYEHDEGKQSNYLGQPMVTEAPVLKAMIAKGVRRKLNA